MRELHRQALLVAALTVGFSFATSPLQAHDRFSPCDHHGGRDGGRHGGRAVLIEPEEVVVVPHRRSVFLVHRRHPVFFARRRHRVFIAPRRQRVFAFREEHEEHEGHHGHHGDRD